MLRGNNMMRVSIATVFLLFFASGFSALLVQVVWMRELGLLFGVTAQAAAATLAAFFLGLALGSAYWGRRADRFARPLRVYALLEAGVLLAALSYFLLAPAFASLYRSLYDQPALAEPALPVLIKLLLTLALLSPAAFFMGGTLPVLSAWFVRYPTALGRSVPLLYGVNTLGAAAGALSAAFLLPPRLGYDGTYLLALALILAIALIAGSLDLRMTPGAAAARSASPRDAPSDDAAALPLPRAWLLGLAMLSGFVALALEVLWTRMFAQVLQNSVYSYAVILVVFLLALAAGSFVAAWLARRRWAFVPTLSVLLCAAALLVASTPHIFFQLTDGLGYLGRGRDWLDYLLALTNAALVTLAAPTLVLGVIFPYLWRASGAAGRGPGEQVGGLLALNTLGAILGSLAAGFLLLEWLGLWRAVQWLAGLYLAAAVLLWTRIGGQAGPDGGRFRPVLAAVPVLGFLLLLSALDAGRLPLLRTDPVRRAEAVLDRSFRRRAVHRFARRHPRRGRSPPAECGRCHLRRHHRRPVRPLEAGQRRVVLRGALRQRRRASGAGRTLRAVGAAISVIGAGVRHPCAHVHRRVPRGDALARRLSAGGADRRAGRSQDPEAIGRRRLA
jgi:spermidine synthase